MMLDPDRELQRFRRRERRLGAIMERRRQLFRRTAVSCFALGALATLAVVVLATLIVLGAGMVHGAERVSPDPYRSGGYVVRDYETGKPTRRVREDPYQRGSLRVEDYDNADGERRVRPDAYDDGSDRIENYDNAE